MKGVFSLKIDGNQFVVPNRISREGVSDFAHWIVDETLNGGPGPSHAGPLYIGLVDQSGYTADATTYTMASHPGWSEFVDYSQAGRQGPITQGSISEVTPSVTSAELSFTITADGELRGIFISDDSTKGGTSGRLFSSAILASPISVSNGGVLTVTYTLKGTFTLVP